MAAAEMERFDGLKCILGMQGWSLGVCVGEGGGGCPRPAPWACRESFALFPADVEMLCAAALALVESKKEIRD